ncbi:ABC-type transport system, periplasmic component/surface lipoprotein [Treponema sp. JC4]|uniref:BMP family ABC transporter substrate-binding protein n=1 Tax=Treponema sp. JC4 TaxID=1124982 RepID=UPI00025AFBBC|nr:BMP family ABC transporter substrate-binding protein [Treponema sp. JC4]EID85396.1 ABC-type transport system, periplasmic component/surface lipoprotein [Treponema sp. JC4]
MIKNKYVLTVLTVMAGILIMFLNTKIFSHSKDENLLKIGFIYNADTATAYSINFFRSQTALEDTFGDKVQVFAKYNIGENGTACEDAIEALVKEGCRLIFTVSYGYGEATKKMAAKYPEVQFCHATGDLADKEPLLANYHNFMGTIHEGRYLCGIIAGLKIRELIASGKIKRNAVKVGYVGAFSYAEVISGYTAFYLGVHSIVPEAEMLVRYTNTWSNHVIEKKTAEKLIDEGCVIISQHSDTSGPAIACEEASVKQGKTVFHVGYNQSMIDVAPTTSLVSCRIDWTPYILNACRAVMEGKKIESLLKSPYKTNDSTGGFDKGWIEIVGLNRHILAAGTEEEISKTEKQFKAGTISVFKGNFIGVNPYDPSDSWDLRKPFNECEKRSAPAFCYVLKDVIEIK